MPILIVLAETHFFEKVAAEEVGLLLCEGAFVHGLDDAVKALNVAVSTLLSAESDQYSLHEAAHGLNLFLGAAKPNIGSVYVPTYPLNIVSLLILIISPPLG